MLTDVRKLLDRVTAARSAASRDGSGANGKAEADEIRTEGLSHTYISARLQTVDNGAPVVA